MTDAHKVVHDDHTEPGCWAGDSEYRACGATAATDLGLCATHLAELRGDDDTPEPAAATAAGHHATFVVTDETHVWLGVDPAHDGMADIAVFVNDRYAGTVGELQARGYAW